MLFAVLVVVTIAGLLALAAYALSAGGFGLADALLLLFFALTMPWSVIGFWNAAIGFLVMRFARDPVAQVVPSVARLRGDEPITASTAITDLRPQRAARPRDPQSRRHDARDRRAPAPPAASISIS